MQVVVVCSGGGCGLELFLLLLFFQGKRLCNLSKNEVVVVEGDDTLYPSKMLTSL